MSDFYEMLKKKMQEHPIGESKVRDASMAYDRAYEKRPEVKARHKAWTQTEAGKKSVCERSKKYAKAHPEKIRAKSRVYYERHKEELSERRKKRRKEDAEFRNHINELNREYNKAMRQNPERTEKNREVRRNWIKNNPEKVKEARKRNYDKMRNDPVRWAKHLEKHREHQRKAKERKKLKEVA